MKSIRKTIYALLTFAAMAPLGGCNSFLKEYSQDLAKVESWNDLDELLRGQAYYMTGYKGEEGDVSNAGESIDILHLMSDEMTVPISADKPDRSAPGEFFGFYTWQRDTGTTETFQYKGGDEEYFNLLYSKINICNMVISLIDEQPEHDSNDAVNKRRVKGEALFLRALYYFTLANLYCEPYRPDKADATMGMPLKFTEYVEDTEFRRASLKDTYDRIVDDLDVADECLEGITQKSIYRANQATVRLLKARVDLYTENYADAIDEARKVLAFNDRLMDLRSFMPGDNCLYGANPEILFSMGNYLVATFFANWRASYASIPNWCISDDMVALYNRQDLRKDLYIGKAQYRDYEPVFRKYNGQSEAEGKWFEVGSVFTFRTSEAYLILAEAAALSGQEQLALETLGRFLPTRITGKIDLNLSGTDLIDFIRDERARELILEGHRWFDLRRYTVNSVRPWSKKIIHDYPYFATEGWDYYVDYVNRYTLEENDPAYTLPIPRDVLNFQNNLGSVERPERRAVKVQ